MALLSSAFEPDDVLRLLELAERRAAEELRALREEAERRTELLRRILEQLASLERTQ